MVRGRGGDVRGSVLFAAAVPARRCGAGDVDRGGAETSVRWSQPADYLAVWLMGGVVAMINGWGGGGERNKQRQQNEKEA